MTRARASAALAGFAMVALAAACADTTIAAEDYDSSCTQNADCVIVVVGDLCGACLTTFAFINDDSEAQYEADLAASASCAPWSARYAVECIVPAPESRPVCAEGTCVAGDVTPCSFDDGTGRCRGVD